MILLDGIQYDIKTPGENATAIVDFINKWCSDKDIRNRKNEVIFIEQNYANPLYIIIFGVSYFISILQNLLYSAGCAVNVASSSASQLLNIADIAGVQRREPTKTTILATVYSNISGAEATPCAITTDLQATVVLGSESIIFHPAYDITIPVGSSATVILVAETYGSYNLSANYITSFDNNPVGFRAMVTEASSPGQELESIADLRVRIQRRAEQGTFLDKAIDAIGQLNGVSVCNIYFNKSIEDTVTINGISVPPRQALLFVQGWSDKIAKTFYQYLDCECAGSSAPTAVAQVYETKAGQELPVYIIPPTLVPVYIRLYYNQIIDDTLKQRMKDAIATLAGHRTIGQRLTSAEVMQLLQERFPSYAPAGCQLSLDNEAYLFQVNPGPFQLIVFDSANIVIQGGDVV